MPTDVVAPPTVSAIMIFLNAERFINAAIESVLAQTGIDDWELVLVDDGSTDASTEMAMAWSHHESGRIRYVAHPGHSNEGMSASRNLGLRTAQGELVAFLDSDDIWLPAMLAQRVRLLRAHPEADAVLGPTWTWFGWTGLPLDRRRDRQITLPHSGLRRPIRPPELFVKVFDQPSAWLVPGICGLCFRRQALLDIGGFEAEFRGMFEDQVLYVKAFTNLTFVLDDRPLTLYRQHAASTCAVAERTPDRADLDRFVTWLTAYIGERFGMDGPEWRTSQATARWADADGHRPSRWFRMKRCLRLTADRVAPRVVGATVNSIYQRRATGVEPDVVHAWTTQFVMAWASSMRGQVLIAHGSAEPPSSAVLDALTHTTAVPAPLLDVRPGQPFDWIIVLPGVFDELNEVAALSTSRSLLAESGSLLALVPGPDLPSSSGRAALRPLRADLGHLARTLFPTATISAEGFGSTDAVNSIRRQHNAARAGVAVDHHDSKVEAMTGLSVIPGSM